MSKATNAEIEKMNAINKEVEVAEVKEKKKQAISKSYTLKSNAANIKKLLETKLITEDEAAIMKDIQRNALEKYMEGEF